jgi:hypothetical protein
MRNILLIFLFLISPSIAFAQSRADYETTIAKFRSFYNNIQSDSICNMFSKKTPQPDNCEFDKAHLKAITGQYGYMKSCQVFLERDGTTLFKTQFIRSTHIMAVSLDKENKFEKFIFKASTSFIDSLASKK